MNNTEILLVNSISLRQRAIADTALENSLVLLRSHLENEGINVKLIDYQRINNIDKGVPRYLLIILRLLVRTQMFTYRHNKAIFAMFVIFSLPIHSLSKRLKQKYNKKIINLITREILNDNIPIVGIKAWYGDSYSWSEQLALSIHKYSPKTIIIIGGPQVNIFREYVLENQYFDLAMAGPSEKKLAELVQFYREINEKEAFLDKVKKDNGNSNFIQCDISIYKNEKNFLSMTIPDYKSEDLEGKLPIHTIVDGVGCCWGKCHFCSHHKIHSNYIPRDIDEIVKEIKVMVTKGIVNFRFSCSDTNLIQGNKIAQAIVDNELQIKFSMFTRASLKPDNDYRIYRLLIKAGLTAVFIGGETGHDQINDIVMNKGIKKKNIIETIMSIRRAADSLGKECFIVLALIYPSPVISGVSLDDIFNETVDLVEKVRPNSITLSPPTPFPNTYWFNNRQKFGFKFTENFIEKLMHYEYNYFKPINTWPKLPIALDSNDFRKCILETYKLGSYFTNKGIPMDLSDEYLIMAKHMGFNNSSDLFRFKKESQIDILSGTTYFIKKIQHALKN